MEWRKENGILTITDSAYKKISFVPPDGLDFGAAYLVVEDQLNRLVYVIGKKLVIGFRNNSVEFQRGAGFTVPIADYPHDLKNAKRMSLHDFQSAWHIWESIVHCQDLLWQMGLPKNMDWFLTMIRAQHLLSTLGQTFNWFIAEHALNNPFSL